MEDSIKQAKRNLELQILETERISIAMEEPDQDRIRTLEGHDPSEEELQQNLSVLENLERNNRELLRSKSATIKELTRRSEDLQLQSNNWKASTGSFLKDINDMQGRLHDLRRVHTAQLSELQMYESLVDKLTSSKAELEHDISLRTNLISKPSREVHVYTTSPMKNQSMEPRPTAYLPAGPDDEIIRVPRPFGKMAPFKPNDPGSTMRHIRKPQPIPLLRPT